jgi:hypothetical protein
LESLAVWSFVCFAFGRMVELIMIGLRRRESKEIEILVLRHKLDSTDLLMVSSVTSHPSPAPHLP